MLSADEARLLDRLTLGGRVSAPTVASSGLRRARTRGAGVEFHEYRHYQPGDDPRAIDWTVEARLGQLVVRVSTAEGHTALHVLMDASASMTIGAPSKFECACKIAAALCYVAIEGRDMAGVACFSDRIHAYTRPAGGRHQLSRIFDTVRSAAASGPSSIDNALESYAALTRGPGLAVVLSDFFVPGNGSSGLHALMHRGLTPALVQTVAREEVDPDFDDDTELSDVENPSAPVVVIDAAAVAAYKLRMTQHSDSLRALCLRHGLPWLRVDTAATFTTVLHGLEQAGLFGV